MDYFVKKKCRLSLKLIKELFLLCPNVGDHAIRSITRYCIKASTEVKCVEARDLLMTLAESQHEQHVKSFQSKKYKLLLAGVMAKSLDFKYKKRERATFTIIWAAKLLKTITMNCGPKESNDAFLGTVRSIVQFLKDPSAKAIRAAEQCLYFVLKLYTEDTKFAEEWITQNGRSPIQKILSSERLSQIVTKYTKMHGRQKKKKNNKKKNSKKAS